ncbi:MAG: hypothetical protein DRJ42_03585 [Deltaproteobacteria bacterium]|nr:MAG: hypothetical protein DRJ42_03585 [Deltaproteobacteria bacterium]
MTDRSAQVGRLLELVVHDLRNPAATIGANVAFARDVVQGGDADLVESLADVEQALGDMVQGLRHVARVARWLTGEESEIIEDADVREAISQVGDLPEGTTVRVKVPDEPLRARGGKALGELLDVLLANAVQHAPGGTVEIEASRDDRGIVVTVTDTGRAVGEDLRQDCFTLAAQDRLKGRADGRYGRAAGLLAARLIAEAMGGSVEAGGVDGAAVFTIRLSSVKP